MSLAAPTPHPQEEPDPSDSPLLAGETAYLELSSLRLQRVHVATELVSRPGHFVHEFRTRLSAAPPEPIAVVVTNRRVTVGEKTYSLDHIVSVSSVEHAKSVGCALIFIGLGALMFAVIMCSAFTLSQFGGGPGARSFFVALVLIGIGVAIYLAAKEHYAVHLSASSGEVDGLMSTDEEPITQIHDAIYQALVERGQ